MSSVPGTACVDALLRAGFERVQAACGFAVLRRIVGDQIQTVLIPEGLVLYDDVIDIVLRTAGVTPSEFEMLVANDVEVIRERA